LEQNETLVEEKVDEYMKEVETNLNNKTYYGHEIKQILSIGRQLLTQLNVSAPTAVAENFTDRVVGIYGDILVNEKTWEQLNDVPY